MLSLTLVALLAADVPADWSRFRGPNGLGTAESTGLPAEFGPTKNVVWKTTLPAGYSSPIISAGLIFVTAVENDKLFTIALDLKTGTEKWRRESPRTRKEKLDRRNGPASPSAVADGRNVFIFFPDYGLLSYDINGKERWKTPLGPFNNIYGMGASPMLVGDKVILVCDPTSPPSIRRPDARCGGSPAPRRSAATRRRFSIRRRARRSRSSWPPAPSVWMRTRQRTAGRSGS
jgi:outer membrane protein assembly factor BamB